MEQKRVSAALTVAGSLATLGGVLVFFVFVPILADECRSMYPELARLYWPGLIGMWSIAAAYLAAMVFYFRIVARIGKDQSFCRANARELGWIARCLGAAGCLWILAIFLPGLVWQADIGPVWLWLFLAAAASFAMGVLAWGLGRLLQRAVSLKEENDLTV